MDIQFQIQSENICTVSEVTIQIRLTPGLEGLGLICQKSSEHVKFETVRPNSNQVSKIVRTNRDTKDQIELFNEKKRVL